MRWRDSYAEHRGSFDIWNAVNTTGMESNSFYILGSFPLGKVLIAVFLVSIFTSFATMADPVAAALATISTHGLSVDDEAPRTLKILFGIIMGTVAYLLVASGGVSSVKGMWVIIGFPIAFIMMVIIVSAFRNAGKCAAKEDHMLLDDPAEAKK